MKKTAAKELPYARLVFLHGVSEASIVGADVTRGLYRVHAGKKGTRIEEHDGVVTVAPEKKGFFGWGAASVALELREDVPWEIEIRSGVSEVEIDLRSLVLRGLTIVGGVSEARIQLGRPRGSAPLRIVGGVSEVRVTRPAGVGLSLHLIGGASDLALDEFRFGAVGGPVRWESHEYRDAFDRYELELKGGASELSIGRHV